MTTTPPAAPGPGPEAPAPPPPPPHDGPRVTRDEIRELGRLRRSTDNRKVAGVAGGLGRHLDVDPLILRVAFVVLTFFGGAGLLLYVACWLLVPEEGAPRTPFGLDERTRGIALLVVGGIAALALLGDSVGRFDFPWPLAIVAVVAVIWLSRHDRRQAPAGDGPPTYATPPAPYATTTGPPAPPVPAAPARGWTPPPPPQNPRRRGPVLFWFTLALSALGIGVLGILDLAGLGIADSAYPALVVAVCGLMLTIGAFWGRAGGLILVGLVAALAMGAATAADGVDRDTVRESPTLASQVQDSYDIHTGELVVDLSGVTDLASLDGRNIDVDGGAGRLRVILPDGLDVEVDASVGVGHILLFGDEQGGFGVESTRGLHSGVTRPEIDLDVQLGVGEIEVTRATTPTPVPSGASR